MKDSIISFLIVLVFPLSVAAQKITPQVIASSGGSYETSTVQLSWTLGELATESFTSGSTMLTQGFQQPEITVETGYSDPEIQLSVNVYPVPAKSYLTVEFNEVWQGMMVNLYNLQGIKILSTPVINQKMEINLHELPSAGYILKVITAENKMIKSYTVIKN
jgi:hypothetical protein